VNYSEIKYCDIANGVGVRTTLFVSGCTHHCKGCFQPETWDFAAGKPFTNAVAQEILDSLDAPHVAGLTLLGGEPMEPANQPVLADLCEKAKAAHPEKAIWCFTGDLYEDLLEGGPRHTADTDRLLGCIDVLVDGPFEADKKDVSLRFRGSSNQRLIDLPKTREAGHVVLWEDDPVFATHAMSPHVQ
jgi:anaerobic ribonucleoside-triphosphate reductase activating protein